MMGERQQTLGRARAGGHSRVHVLQLLEQPLVLPTDELLVPEHHVAHREQVSVLPAQALVLAHVVLDQLDQRGGVQLVQPALVNLLLCGGCGWGGGGGCWSTGTHLDYMATLATASLCSLLPD